MTKARETILKLLSEVTEPVSATQIDKKIEPSCDQATVYRTMHYLENHGYIESFVLFCSEHGTERYYTLKNDETQTTHRHWFHCETCHRFIDLGTCTIAKVLSSFEAEQKITIRQHTFYCTGLCNECGTTSEQIQGSTAIVSTLLLYN